MFRDETLEMNFHWLFNFFSRRKWKQNKSSWGKPVLLQFEQQNTNNNNNNNTTNNNNNDGIQQPNNSANNNIGEDDDDKDKCKICFEEEIQWYSN